MIDSLAFQPALGWYQVPFWLGDVCPRGRRHDVLNRRMLNLFLGSVELTRGVRRVSGMTGFVSHDDSEGKDLEKHEKQDLRQLVSTPTRTSRRWRRIRLGLVAGAAARRSVVLLSKPALSRLPARPPLAWWRSG